MFDSIQNLIAEARTRRWLAYALAAAVAAVFVFAWVVVPRGGEALEVYRAWTAQVDRIEQAKDWQRDLQRLEARRRIAQARLDSLVVRVPSADRMSVVLERLHEEARSAGVDVREVHPGDRDAADVYVRLPLDLVVRGSYHAVGRFVDALERMEYLVVVRALSIEPSSTERAETSAPSRSPTVDARIQLGLMALQPRGRAAP